MGNEILKLINIKKEFDNSFVAVKKFDLSIDKSDFVTFLGPSGCGKTTVLKMIAGFDYPTNGRILYKGLDIKNMSVNDRPTATVFQDYALFPNMTVIQNIEYGLKIMTTRKENVDEENIKNIKKVYNDAKKKSDNELLKLKRKMLAIKKDISKCEKEYEKKKDWYDIRKMRLPEFLKTIKKIDNEMYKVLGDKFTSKQTFLNSFKGKANTLLLRMRIRYRFDIKTKNMNDYERQINKLTKSYTSKCIVDKKYDNLVIKLNDLDYDISYWETFPILTKEKFIENNLTRRLNKIEIKERSNKVIELVGLKGKENSMPNELSGGMQQRVALARAIVIEPKILLLDEPLSALDAKVRKQMQLEMKRLHKELGITFILVTHDQEEALSLSSKVVVMSNGQIEQVGTPNEIYDTPSNKWVAQFIGRANFFKGNFVSEGKVEFLNKVHKCTKKYKFKPLTKIEVMIRPEDFDVVAPGNGFIDVKVESIDYKGLLWDIKCSYNNNIIIYVEGINEVSLNKMIGLKWDLEDIHLIKGVSNVANIRK